MFYRIQKKTTFFVAITIIVAIQTKKKKIYDLLCTTKIDVRKRNGRNYKRRIV
jgi:hypothetical protein